MLVHFIDVGQGAATLFEFPCGAVLVDTGGESHSEFDSTVALESYLDAFFARRTDLAGRLDSLILTHPHIDHTRGVKMVIEKYPPKNAVTNGQTTGSGRFGQIALHNYASAGEETSDDSDDVGFEAVSLSSIPESAGLTNEVIDPISCGSVDPKISILWGRVSSNPGWPTKEFANANNHSLVVRLEVGSSSVLISGDLEDHAIEKLLERYGGTSVLDTDVYLVGHHGSKNGTTPNFVTAMSPSMAVFPVGPADREVAWTAWDHGHPSQGIVRMIEKGISGKRASPLTLRVGTGSEKFVDQTVAGALYFTGVEGTVLVRGPKAGEPTVVGSESSAALVNVNTAPHADLEMLPGIGPSRAAAIIDYRAAHGAFTKLEDLDNVPGIGPATLTGLQGLITF